MTELVDKTVVTTYRPTHRRAAPSFAEARALFSTADAQYAFGETDDAGNANLASFAAAADRPYEYQFMPAEGRVYFARKTP